MWKILSSSKRRDAASPLPVPDLCGHPVALVTDELYHFRIDRVKVTLSAPVAETATVRYAY